MQGKQPTFYAITLAPRYSFLRCEFKLSFFRKITLPSLINLLSKSHDPPFWYIYQDCKHKCKDFMESLDQCLYPPLVPNPYSTDIRGSEESFIHRYLFGYSPSCVPNKTFWGKEEGKIRERTIWKPNSWKFLVCNSENLAVLFKLTILAWLSHLRVIWPWMKYWTCLHLSFSISKINIPCLHQQIYWFLNKMTYGNPAFL